MILAAQVIVAVVAVPVVALLVRDAGRRRRPIASLATAAAVGVAGSQWLTAVMDADRAQSVLNAVLDPAVLVLLATYPNGRLFPRWTIVPVLLGIAAQVGNVLSGFTWDTQSWWPAHYLLTWLPLLLGGQLYRFVRRSTVEERRRASWPLLAAVVQVCVFTVGSSIQWGATGSLDGIEAATAASHLLNALLPFGFAVGLLAPGLFRVDRALRAALAVGPTALVLVGVFAGTVALLGAGGVAPAGAGWIGAALVAGLTWPLGRLGGRIADRLVYGTRSDPLVALAQLGERLEKPLRPREVPTTVVETAARALALPGARIRLADGTTVTTGDEPAGDAVEGFDVVYQGEALARIEVAPRIGEAELSPRDRETLAHLARQAGPALRDATTIDELEHARRRLVLAREEERRRLRRDLHDDLAPTFAGLALGAEAARRYVADADPRAADVAERLVRGLADATRQVREIAYDLRPPILDDRGLVAAIRDRVESGAGAPVVTVDAPDGPLGLPAAVEAAALRFVQEAVVNVRRHAAATVCRVSLARDEGAVRISVEDDGVGIDPGHRAGVGLQSMRERVAELRGEFEIERLPRGTRVSATLPLTADGARE